MKQLHPQKFTKNWKPKDNATYFVIYYDDYNESWDYYDSFNKATMDSLLDWLEDQNFNECAYYEIMPDDYLNWAPVEDDKILPENYIGAAQPLNIPEDYDWADGYMQDTFKFENYEEDGSPVYFYYEEADDFAFNNRDTATFQPIAYIPIWIPRWGDDVDGP